MARTLLAKVGDVILSQAITRAINGCSFTLFVAVMGDIFGKWTLSKALLYVLAVALPFVFVVTGYHGWVVPHRMATLRKQREQQRLLRRRDELLDAALAAIRDILRCLYLAGSGAGVNILTCTNFGTVS